MTSKADRAIHLITQIEDDARVSAIKEILSDLRSYTGPERHTEGYEAAIDVIASNYSTKSLR